jgi:FAD/FMN-containing dehydrogenase
MALKSYRHLDARNAAVSAQLDEADPKALSRLGLTAASLRALALAFHGKLVLRGMPGYDQDRESNPLYDERPLAIAYCATVADVALMLDLARKAGLWIACRSGGHSTAGYSVNSGLVIDTSLLNAVLVDPDKREVLVGAGTNFGQLNATLDIYQLHVPGGGCSTVCVAGYMQGGGYGFTSRQYGMNCDNVLGFSMMLADGSIVKASATRNPDLFWAVRGGTGNNFGVLLDITYRLHDLYEVWGFGLHWDLDAAADALVALQSGFMTRGAPDALGHQIFLGTSKHGKGVTMLGMFNGSRASGMAALAPLLDVGAPNIVFDRTGTYASLNEALLDEMTPPVDGLVEFKRSGYIETTVDRAGWQKLVDCLARAPNEFALIGLEVYGGAINAYPCDGNAFIHRAVSCNLFIDSFFDATGSPTSREQAAEWLESALGTISPYFNGHVYQNYPVRGLPEFWHAYWGPAYPALRAAKRKYDPGNMFHYEQSIDAGPALEDAGRTASGAEPILRTTPPR